jgi:predicted RNA binding protein YcfA (HicA-like mRNA interferase family)
MTDSEALRRLVRAGWHIQRRAKGSHVILKRGAERLVAAVGRNGKHGLSPGQRSMVRRATGERP